MTIDISKYTSTDNKSPSIDISKYSGGIDISKYLETSQQTQPSVSAGKVLKQEALYSAAPAVGGALAGIKAAALASPLASVPVAGPFLVLGAGLVGAIGGATLVGKIQKGIIKAIVGNETEIKMEEKRAKEAKEHPVAAFVGETAPQLLMFKPSPKNVINAAKFAKTLFTTTDKAILKKFISSPTGQKELSNLINVAVGGGVQGGQELVNQVKTGDYNAVKLTARTVLGAIINEPNKFGVKLGIHPTEGVILEENVAPTVKSDINIKLGENIRGYRTYGGASAGKESPNAYLRDINAQLNTPEGKMISKKSVDDAIAKGELKVGADGKIPIYRIGEPSKLNDLYSATYDKDFAQQFSKAVRAPVKEIRVSPEEIKYVIGGAEKEVLLSKSKAIENPLYQEARKYKSAEEFVKAQGTPVYHGTQVKFDKFDSKFATDAEGRKLNLGWGKGNFYFTTKKGEALKYATRERSPEVAKLYPKGEPNVIEAFVDIKKPFDMEVGKNAERWRKVRDGYWTDGVSDFNYHKISKGKTKAEAFVEQLKKEGYDGIIDGQEITAFSENQIKTKSQLISIWNEANKIKVQPKITQERITQDAEVLKRTFTDETGNVDPIFRNTNLEEQAKIANEVWDSVGNDRAIDIGFGMVKSPDEKLNPIALIEILKNNSEKLTMKQKNRLIDEGGLSVPERQAGQTLKLTQLGEKDNPIDNIIEVEKARAERVKKTFGSIKEELKKNIKKNFMC